MDVAVSERHTPELTLTGTFTLEPIQEVLTFWLQEHDVGARLSVAPYAQVFPQLLDPGSLVRTRRTGLNVVLVRLEDWLGSPGSDTQALSRATTECAAALQAAVDGSPVPYLFVSCPPSPDNAHARLLEECESELRKTCERLGVAFVGSRSLVDDYALAGWHDAYRLKEAHIPYTAPAIAAIGTTVARHFLALTRAPVKVIVLDCDHTLWGGIVGEDGPDGLVIDEPRRVLQARMRALREQGVLLCLCSKNDDADVLDVFARRGAEMPLSLEHIVARRINWRPKSENLRDLARELNLGLDSFVMLDDNPLECAEVASGCPGVTVLRLPQDASEIPRFLKHCWVFDRATTVTAEDRERPAMVAAEREREAHLARAASLDEFVATLALEVVIRPLGPEHHARVSQLSLRTNQFNLSGTRRSESDLRQALREGLRGFVVDVRDRFGDYGLVGTVLYRVDDAAIVVDSWLLSCRALGRGVEHRMLVELGHLALQSNRAAIVLPLVSTDRNAPIRAFLEEVAQQAPPGSGTGEPWRVNAEEAVAARWQPRAGGRERPTPQAQTPKQREARQPRVQELLARIPSIYSTGAAIAEAVQQMARASAADRAQKRAAVAGDNARAPLTPLERQILGLFREVLADDAIGLETDFFQLGGHSLLATTLMGRVAAECGIHVPLHVLFENPTPAGIAAAVERARVASEADRAIAGEEHPRLAPDPAHLHEPFPLTPLQTAYWVGRTSWLGLGNVGTHNYVELDYRDLDLARYERAWQETIQRHPMLRAVVDEDGRQRILETVRPYRITITDLRGSRPDEAERGAQAVRARMERQVLPLTSWPTFEVSATLLPDGRTRIHTSFDGLMLDLWSTRLVAREVALRYVDPGRPFPALDVSFRDFVLAEQKHRASAAFDRAERYWSDRLETLPPAPDLPLARDPASVERPRFARLRASLDAPSWSRVVARARAAHLTPSAFLLALFAEVLQRWSKSSRFTINVTLFHRPPVHPLINELVGDFTSLVMLEIDDGGARGDRATFEGRAQALQDRLWRDLDHRMFTGVEVLREIARRRGLAAASMPVVFTSALSLDLPYHDGSVAGFRGDLAYARTQTPQVWLDHQVFENEGALEFNWDYVPELFPAGTVEGMFESYCDALERVASPDEARDDRAGPVRLPARMRATRVACNATEGPVPAGLLHEPFEQQAEQNPERVAVVSEDGVVTYGELRRRARHLAVRLRELGARPNSLVAVAARKGIDQVTSVLGVLMAGAAYLPIDADLPPDRIHHLIGHGEVRIVLSQSRLSLDLPGEVRVINVDRDVPAGPAPRVDPVQQASDLAYVIYTSGSTGLPKGVMISHRAALNTIVDINERFGIGPCDRVLAVSSLSFDLSVWDIFGLLAAGGAIVMPSPGIGPSPGHWVELIGRYAVTVWNTVPALMGLLVEEGGSPMASIASGLRLVMMSGDWIPLALPGQIRAVAPAARIVSLGGATEGAIWSILHPIESVDPAWASIPYGRPMRNQRFYVFDHMLRERPDHVPGQLYIGGVGVAEGYWRDPERTRERFVTHPDTGERLYWTGDLGRRMADATIEFLGREDFQVKIQGYRVELGEVEAVLVQHPDVRTAVVAAAGEQKGTKRLVGYLVPREGNGVDIPSVRALASERLPRYMVPSAFVVLTSLPLTSNGKVDRKTLPLPALERPESARAYVAPRNPAEQVLNEIWSEALGLERVGVHDNFFELGGDSLMAIRIIAEANRAGMRLAFNHIFEHQTIAELAARAGEADLGATVRRQPRQTVRRSVANL